MISISCKNGCQSKCKCKFFEIEFNFKHDKHHCRCKSHHQSCQESLSKLLASVAHIENALANAINAESEILKEGNLTPEQVLMLSNKLEDLIKLAIKKEMILEFLIEDAIKACKTAENATKATN
ncbi:hypothetical protein [Cytobacillus sp.]|uniref:hypothetical protein n=1 Tax=Cytobacillus sp. TaxID=2675269 RepID=UPI0028BD89A0|nr:hypothetical protein [Cytobacillus sp.]